MSGFLEFDKVLVFFFFLLLSKAEVKILVKLDGLVRNACILLVVAVVLSKGSGMLPNLKPIRPLFLKDRYSVQ